MAEYLCIEGHGPITGTFSSSKPIPDGLSVRISSNIFPASSTRVFMLLVRHSGRLTECYCTAQYLLVKNSSA